MVILIYTTEVSLKICQCYICVLFKKSLAEILTKLHLVARKTLLLLMQWFDLYVNCNTKSIIFCKYWNVFYQNFLQRNNQLFVWYQKHVEVLKLFRNSFLKWTKVNQNQNNSTKLGVTAICPTIWVLVLVYKLVTNPSFVTQS